MKGIKKKGVSIKENRGRKVAYNFADVKIGESLFFKDISVKNINGAYQNFKRKNPEYKFAMRSEYDKNGVYLGCYAHRIPVTNTQPSQKKKGKDK